jgi:hypothetical protein
MKNNILTWQRAEATTTRVGGDGGTPAACWEATMQVAGGVEGLVPEVGGDGVELGSWLRYAGGHASNESYCTHESWSSGS